MSDGRLAAIDIGSDTMHMCVQRFSVEKLPITSAMLRERRGTF
jgi:exopolyphosphatase/pppGpp-phosphohydrolase